MPDEKKPAEPGAQTPPAEKHWYDGPGSKPGEWEPPKGSRGQKDSWGKTTKGRGNEKESTGHKAHETEHEFTYGPVYKKTFIDTDNSPEHQKKFSTKEGERDLTYRSWLNAKVEAEVLSASYDPEKIVGKVTAVNIKAEGSLLHAQTGLKVDVGKALGDALKRMIFDEVEVPGPNPPSAPAPMAARVGDITAHLAPLAPGVGSVNVIIGGMPAWRVGPDMHLCPAPGFPHGLGPAMPGAPTVLINGFPAARASDFIVEPTGGPDVIMLGCPTVMIGVSAPPPTGAPGKATRSWAGSLLEGALDSLSGLVLFESVPAGDLVKVEVEAKLGGEVDFEKAKGKVEASAGALIAAAKGEIPVKIRLRVPFTNQFLGVGVTAEGSLLSAGAEANARAAFNENGKTAEFSVGAKAGAGLAGAGIKGTADLAPAGEDYPHLAEKKGPAPSK